MEGTKDYTEDMDYYMKLKAFLEALEVQDVGLLLDTGTADDFKRLGEAMAMRTKELRNIADRVPNAPSPLEGGEA